MTESSDNKKDAIFRRIHEYLNERSGNDPEKLSKFTKVACEKKEYLINNIHDRLTNDHTYSPKTPITEADVHEALSCPPPKTPANPKAHNVSEVTSTQR